MIINQAEAVVTLPTRDAINARLNSQSPARKKKGQTALTQPGIKGHFGVRCAAGALSWIRKAFSVDIC